MSIRIQEEDFDLGSEVKSLYASGGAVVSFVGLVRDLGDDNKPITSMTLEHYPEMTERELERIKDEAIKRWSLDSALIIHRVGKLLAGEQIVLVATAASHREAAFESAWFIMDYLKTDAPFWKLEEIDGKSAWVTERRSDLKAKKRWQK